MRSVRMTRHLDLLPRRKLGIGLAELAIDPGLQPLDLVDNADFAVVAEMA